MIDGVIEVPRDDFVAAGELEGLRPQTTASFDQGFDDGHARMSREPTVRHFARRVVQPVFQKLTAYPVCVRSLLLGLLRPLPNPHRLLQLRVNLGRWRRRRLAGLRRRRRLLRLLVLLHLLRSDPEERGVNLQRFPGLHCAIRVVPIEQRAKDRDQLKRLVESQAMLRKHVLISEIQVLGAEFLLEQKPVLGRIESHALIGDVLPRGFRFDSLLDALRPRGNDWL